MDRFYKVTVQLYGSSSIIIYSSGRFYSYVVSKFRAEVEAKGLRPASFSPEPVSDLEIIECIKIKEKGYPVEFSNENLNEYGSE